MLRKRLGHRRIRIETLESRTLMAADVFQNPIDANDVNDDGDVTPADALVVLNRIQRGGENDAGRDRMYADVSGDGALSPQDALRVINRIDRDRGTNREENRRDRTAPNEPRSFDGTGNNLENPELGSIDTPLLREVDAAYADGISELAGQDRPNVREISNLVSDQEGSIESSHRLSQLVYLWGQFIDHDLDLTENR